MINIAIIVGAASGLIVFNFILVTWCLFCQRRHDVKLQTSDLHKHKYPAVGKGPLPPLASAKVRTRRSDRPRKLSTLVPATINDAPSVYSDDTASVYSAASAPLEIHDHLLRSHNPLNIIPLSASERFNTALVGPRNLLFPPYSVNCLSTMEEGLNPETYQRSAWDQTPNRFLPPGLVVSPPPTASTPMPSPYSPPSKW